MKPSCFFSHSTLNLSYPIVQYLHSTKKTKTPAVQTERANAKRHGETLGEGEGEQEGLRRRA
jgi:hypothetical protein